MTPGPGLSLLSNLSLTSYFCACAPYLMKMPNNSNPGIHKGNKLSSPFLVKLLFQRRLLAGLRRTTGPPWHITCMLKNFKKVPKLLIMLS